MYSDIVHQLTINEKFTIFRSVSNTKNWDHRLYRVIIHFALREKLQGIRVFVQ